MILNWDASAFGKQNVVELHIYRDSALAGSGAAPFYVVSDPVTLAQGYIDLSPLYSDNWPGLARMVLYNTVGTDGSLLPMAYGWSAEGCGTAHTYQICAVVAKKMGRKVRYSYRTDGFPAPVTMTCVEPITADPDHIVQPWPHEPILISDLREGNMNLAWKSVGGATEYVVTVQPVDPEVGGVWHSSIVYHYSGPWSDGATLSLSDSDRLALAAWLSGPMFTDQDIMWRVDARNGTDTTPYWTVGDWNVFHIDPTPPGPPSWP